MPRGLRRIHGGGDLHFITSSCYHREPLLGSARSRDVFLQIFEQVRRRYEFEVIGYVVMPEHIHLLIGEPKRCTVPIVAQVLKQRVNVRLLRRRKRTNQRELWERLPRRRFWQRRYYDFNVYSERKISEKLHYMHWNPVRRGLVPEPEFWRWSSCRDYAGLEPGIVKLYWQAPANKPETNQNSTPGTSGGLAAHPPNTTEGRAPTSSLRPPKAKAHNAK